MLPDIEPGRDKDVAPQRRSRMIGLFSEAVGSSIHGHYEPVTAEGLAVLILDNEPHQGFRGHTWVAVYSPQFRLGGGIEITKPEGREPVVTSTFGYGRVNVPLESINVIHVNSRSGEECLNGARVRLRDLPGKQQQLR